MRLEVDAAGAGRRVDQLLADVDGIDSRNQAERLVRDGLVLVNGRPPAKSHRLRVGDVVEVDDAALAPPPPTRYAGSADVDVAWEDDHLLVVDKPAGLIVHPAPGNRALTLVEMLAESGVQLAPSDDERVFRPGVVHRLDKDTSGLIMLAKTPQALRALQQALQDRTARREYLALIEGHVPSRAGRIEAPIGPDVRDKSRQSIETDNPREAMTHFVVTEILPDTMLLRVRLETGRTHQIRVHLQAIGHPVVADPLYGGAAQGGQRHAFGLERQFLHAARLTFPHPLTGGPVEVASPLPDDLQAALAEARRQG